VGFLSSLFGGGNPIDTFSLDELKVTEIQLNKKVEEIHAEVRRIDQEVQHNYDLAKESASKSEELSYARRIKTLLQKKEMKISSQSQIEKQLRAVSNILILKEREKDLPDDVLKRLKKIDPEKMEHYLISQKLDAMNDDAQINAITDMTSGTMEVGIEAEDDLSDILDTIRSGKEGSVTASPEPSKVKKTELE
jgi:transposase